jgi:hypothetical protein
MTEIENLEMYFSRVGVQASLVTSLIDKAREQIKPANNGKNLVRSCIRHSPIMFIFLLAIIISLATPALCQALPDQGTAMPPAGSQGKAMPPPSFQSPLSIPSQFSGDWYSVDGGPDLRISLARSSVYQNEDTSLYLTITNIGRVTSFKVVSEPEQSRPDEMFAAQKELALEALRSSAQDVSIQLVAENKSAMNLKREVAYAGSLRDGQVSAPLEYPVEVYENTLPGDYTLYAIANYTYQQDVAVKPHSDSPDNPDVFYWYNNARQIIPLTLHIEKRSRVDLKALNVSPVSLSVGSKNNIIKIFIQNNGSDDARDLVARLRPETGLYVDADESPISRLPPGEKAELIYKVDVSKDAVSGKLYRFTLEFDYSDSFRKNLQDSDYAYIRVQPNLEGIILQYWWLVLIVIELMALVLIFRIRGKKNAAGQ